MKTYEAEYTNPKTGKTEKRRVTVPPRFQKARAVYEVRPEVLTDNSVVFNVVRASDGEQICFPASREEAKKICDLLNGCP